MSDIPGKKKVYAIVLDGGLDFRSTKSLLKPGTLSDCLNYEVVDHTGYKSINGFLRYDGSAYIQDENIFYLRSTSGTSVLNTSQVGKLLYVPGKYSKSYPFGILVAAHSVASNNNYVFYFRIDQRYEPEFGD